jgi:hypothetical protein
MTFAFDRMAPPGTELRDYLSTPSRGACALAGGLLAASTCFCGAAAATGNPVPAVLGSPFFVGAILGLFAFRRPALVTSIAAFLGLEVLVAWIAAVADRGEVAPLVFWVAGAVLLFILPLMILGAVCAATVRRRARGHVWVAPWT